MKQHSRFTSSLKTAKRSFLEVRPGKCCKSLLCRSPVIITRTHGLMPKPSSTKKGLSRSAMMMRRKALQRLYVTAEERWLCKIQTIAAADETEAEAEARRREDRRAWDRARDRRRRAADGFRPCEGGVLELSGVFGGSFNFSRSAAFSARNAPLSASRRDSRAVNISTCRFSAAIVSARVKTKRIRASLSSKSRASRFIQSLNQRSPALSKPHLDPLELSIPR